MTPSSIVAMAIAAIGVGVLAKPIFGAIGNGLTWLEGKVFGKVNSLPVVVANPDLSAAVVDTENDFDTLARAELVTASNTIVADGLTQKTLTDMAANMVNTFKTSVSQAELDKLLQAYGAAGQGALDGILHKTALASLATHVASGSAEKITSTLKDGRKVVGVASQPA